MDLNEDRAIDCSFLIRYLLDDVPDQLWAIRCTVCGQPDQSRRLLPKKCQIANVGFPPATSENVGLKNAF
jgi:hypothetical protein